LATLTDFRLRISAKLGLDNTVAGDQGLIDSWVNEAVSEVLTRSRVNVAVGTMALTSGSSDYTLPTQILALDEMYVTSAGSSTDTYQMYRKNPLEILQMRIGGAGGTPPVRFYAISGTSLLMVYPTPAAADVLTLYYVPRPATLTTGTDTPSDIPVEWHKVVEYYGCWQAAQFTDSATTQEGNLYRQLYEDELRLMKRAAIHRGGRKLSPAVVGRGMGTARYVGSPSQQGV
jgi:hypothetical protein